MVGSTDGIGGNTSGAGSVAPGSQSSEHGGFKHNPVGKDSSGRKIQPAISEPKRNETAPDAIDIDFANFVSKRLGKEYEDSGPPAKKLEELPARKLEDPPVQNLKKSVSEESGSQHFEVNFDDEAEATQRLVDGIESFLFDNSEDDRSTALQQDPWSPQPQSSDKRASTFKTGPLEEGERISGVHTRQLLSVLRQGEEQSEVAEREAALKQSFLDQSWRDGYSEIKQHFGVKMPLPRSLEQKESGVRFFQEKIDVCTQLKAEVSRVAIAEIDEVDAALQELVRYQSLIKNEDTFDPYAKNISELEQHINKVEKDANEITGEIDRQIAQFEKKIKSIQDPTYRTKELEAQRKEALDAKKKELAAQITEYAREQKVKIQSRQLALDAKAQVHIKENNKFIFNLEHRETASPSDIDATIGYLQNSLDNAYAQHKRATQDSSAISEKISNVAHVLEQSGISTTQFFTEWEDYQPSGKVSPALDSISSEEAKALTKKYGLSLDSLVALKEQSQQCEHRLSRLTEKIERCSVLSDELNKVGAGAAEALDPEKIKRLTGVFKEQVQEENTRLRQTIEQRKEAVQRAHESIDSDLALNIEKMSGAVFPFFEGKPQTFEEVWGTSPPEGYQEAEVSGSDLRTISKFTGVSTDGVVQSADTLPFAIKQGPSTDEALRVSETSKHSLSELFYESAPLLIGKESFGTIGTIGTRRSYGTFKTEKPGPIVYGYDANIDSARKVNKKKIRKYRVLFASFGAKLKSIINRVRHPFKDKNRIKQEVFDEWPKADSGSWPAVKGDGHVVTMVGTSDSPFHAPLQDDQFYVKFNDLYDKRYKNDVTGLQYFHDIVSTTLSGSITFTDYEKSGGYDRALASLVMVGAGLIDAKNEEGDVLNYHLLDAPSEQVLGVRLPIDASSEEKAQLLMQAREQQASTKHRAKDITPKHLRRAGKILKRLADVKASVIEANEKAKAEGKQEEVQNVDDAVKEALLQLIEDKARKKVPADLRTKLEVLRENLFGFLPDSDALTAPASEAVDNYHQQRVPTREEISAVESRYYNAVLGQSAADLGMDDPLATPADVLKEKLDDMTKAREQQDNLFNTAKVDIAEELSRTRILTDETKRIISDAILAHCGITIPTDPSSVGAYTLTDLPIKKEQVQAAEACVEEVAKYIDAGNSPTASGVYALITAKPPMSIHGVGPEKFTKDMPHHPLDSTDLKQELEAAFKKEELVGDDSRASKESISLDQLREEVSNILQNSGVFFAEQKGMSPAVVDVLAAHIVPDGEGQLTSKQVTQSRAVAHSLKELMTDRYGKAGKKDKKIKPADLARTVYPEISKKRKSLMSELSMIWKQ